MRARQRWTGLGVAALLAGSSPAAAQDWLAQNHPGNLYDFHIANVLPFGQPVIPLFEGYYPNADGTKSLSFGYFNMNLEETFEIPVGPDNFLEPARFNGMQPTHFMAAPTDRGRNHRHQSVFTVVVPGDWEEPVTWTIRIRGQTFTTKATPTGETFYMDDAQSVTSSPLAAILQFDDDDPRVFGRNGPVTGPLQATVGVPVPLSIRVDPQGRPSSTVTWYHHQGPGRVAFGENATEITAPAEVGTTATFSEPGDYVIRVTALENTQAMVQHCCWTNAYVKVTVAP